MFLKISILSLNVRVIHRLSLLVVLIKLYVIVLYWSEYMRILLDNNNFSILDFSL